MRNRTKDTLRLTALAAALLSVYGTALADDAQGSVSVGGGGWTNDRHQAGMYDGMRDKGVYPILDADVKKRDEESGLSWGLKVRNLGLETREASGSVERQGDIGGSIEYTRIPKDNPFTIDTRLIRNGTREITSNPCIVPGTGKDLELSTVRDRYTAKFYKALGNGFTFNASYRVENKDGNRQWGRGGAPEFAIEPINSTTRQWEAVLNYADPKLQLSAGYYGTAYDNSNGLVVTSLSRSRVRDHVQPHPAARQQVAPVFRRWRLQLHADDARHVQGVLPARDAGRDVPTSRAGLLFPAGQAPIAGAPNHLNGQLDTTLVEAG